MDVLHFQPFGSLQLKLHQHPNVHSIYDCVRNHFCNQHPFKIDSETVLESLWKEIAFPNLIVSVFRAHMALASTDPLIPRAHGITLPTKIALRLPFQGVRKLRRKTPSGIPTGLAASRHAPASSSSAMWCHSFLKPYPWPSSALYKIPPFGKRFPSSTNFQSTNQ